MTMKNEDNLRELTPKSIACGIGVCPAVYELKRQTLNEMCGIGTCPEIYAGQEGDYLVIGKKVNPADFGLEGKVGKDEVLISVPKKLIDEKQK